EWPQLVGGQERLPLRHTVGVTLHIQGGVIRQDRVVGAARGDEEPVYGDFSGILFRANAGVKTVANRHHVAGAYVVVQEITTDLRAGRPIVEEVEQLLCTEDGVRGEELRKLLLGAHG